jgi:type II secretory pathway component PulF
VHILQNSLFAQYWYFFIVFIGIGISIVYYVNHKRSSFRKSLLLLFVLGIFSFFIHNSQETNFDNRFNLNGISGIEDDHFGTSPDYLGNVLERVYDFIKRRFL